MSNLIHCDGPDCDETKDNTPGVIIRQLCEASWFALERDGERLDFHDDQCLANWTTGKPRTAASSQPCMCDGSQIDPHTVAQHRPRSMGVNGL